MSSSRTREKEHIKLQQERRLWFIEVVSIHHADNFRKQCDCSLEVVLGRDDAMLNATHLDRCEREHCAETLMKQRQRNWKRELPRRQDPFIEQDQGCTCDDPIRDEASLQGKQGELVENQFRIGIFIR